MSDQTITIRQLKLDEWETLRTLRLQALKECESAYTAFYEEAVKRSDSEWQDMLYGEDKAIFVLYEDEKPIGLASIFTSRDDPSGKTGVLAMGYIASEYREQGLSKFLYRARLDWAQNHPVIEKIVMAHRAGNEAAHRAIAAQNFKPAGEEYMRFGDGTEDKAYQYVLELKK